MLCRKFSLPSSERPYLAGEILILLSGVWVVSSTFTTPEKKNKCFLLTLFYFGLVLLLLRTPSPRRAFILLKKPRGHVFPYVLFLPAYPKIPKLVFKKVFSGGKGGPGRGVLCKGGSWGAPEKTQMPPRDYKKKSMGSVPR